MELIFGEARVVKMGWVAVIGAGTPKDIASKAGDPLLLLTVGASFDRRHASFQPRLARVEPVGMLALAVAEHGGHLRRQRAIRLPRDSMAPSLAGRRFVKAIEQAGLQQQRGEIQRRDCQRRIDRLQRSAGPAYSAAHAGKLQQDRRVARLGLRGLAQEGQRAVKFLGRRSPVGVRQQRCSGPAQSE